MVTDMSSLDHSIARLADIRRMRAAYGGAYNKLLACDHCQAPTGAHWPDCDRTDRSACPWDRRRPPACSHRTRM